MRTKPLYYEAIAIVAILTITMLNMTSVMAWTSMETRYTWPRGLFKVGDAYSEAAQVGAYAYAYKFDNWDKKSFPLIWIETYEDNEITVYSTDGVYFNWASTMGISAVIVKGGTAVNIFYYVPPATSDTGLYAPINPETGKPYAVSHVTFCWGVAPPIVSIWIAKFGPEYAHVGDEITYEYHVWAIGGSISDVNVVDNVTGKATYVSGDDGDGLLEVGEVWIFTATYTVNVGDPDPLVNTAKASGTYDDTPVSATDSWTVDILHPAIDVIKSANATMIHEGDWVEYNVTVVNTGDCDLYVTLEDEMLGIDWTGTLEPGGKYEAIVDFQPTEDPTSNTASASGTDALGGVVSDDDSWTVDILYPAIAIEKSADKDKAYAGDVITYTYTVTNAGDTPLKDVGVVDDVADEATYVSGDDGDGLLEVGEVWNFTATYTVKTGDQDPLVNTATASGKDALGMEVFNKDTATVDLIAKICGYKFYDTDLNGIWDESEPPVKGIKIELWFAGSKFAETTTGSDGSYCFDELDAGTYMVEEVLPTNWINMTPTSLTVTLKSGEISEDNNFGNVCLMPGTGGRTLGFWSNKNGQALITSSDVTELNELNLYKPSGWAYPPFSGDLATAKTQIKNYLLSATAKDMRWMLSAQLIATKLNVLHGFLDGSTIVYVGSSTYVPSGFISINEIMANANTALSGTDRTDRVVQEYWKNLLDGVNNNRLPFVCPKPCPIEYP